MLQKKERLTRKEFEHFFNTGKRIHGDHAQLIYAPSSTFHGSVVVGKKVYKKAVDRNSLRRRLYARIYAAFKEASPRMTYILIAKPAIAKLSRAQVKSSIDTLLSKAPTA